jgi:hypothetical protein
MKILALIGLAAALSSCTAYGSSINVSTGLDASNNLITVGGQPDAHWVVQEANGSTGAAQVVEPNNQDWWGVPGSGWVANGPNSAWIARDANDAFAGLGPYTFTTTFDLTGADLSQQVLTGAWAVDDSAVLALNGTTIATLARNPGMYPGPWISLNSFSASGAGMFVNGVNTLSITLTTDDGWDGVRLEGSVGPPASTMTPEPATWMLFGLGSAGLMLFAGFRKRTS